MGTWNEDMLAKLAGLPGADPALAANAAALQAIMASNAAVQTSNAAVQTSNANILTALQARLPVVSATATTTAQTLAAATAKTVLAANANRLGAAIQNDTGQTVLIAFGSAAGTSSYATKILNGAYYELPFRYTGLISAYSTTASAAPHLLVTEFTA